MIKQKQLELNDIDNINLNTENQSVFGAINELLEKTTYNSYGTVVLPTLTKEVDFSVTIGNDGSAIFNESVDGAGTFFKFENITGTNIPIPTNSIRYIYLDYNTGNPIYAITDNPNIFLDNATLVPVTRVINDSFLLHFQEYDEYGVSLSNKALNKDIALNDFERQTGLILSSSPTRICKLTGGLIWFGVEYWNVIENEAGVSGSLYRYYQVAGVWQRSANLTEYDATYYCDGTDQQTLTNNKWVAKYFFRDAGEDNEMYYVSGNQYNSKLDAVAEELPEIPTIISAHALYVGKIVIQKDALDGDVYRRTWGTTLQTTPVEIHNELTGLQGGDSILDNFYHNPSDVQAITKEHTGFRYPDDVIITDNSDRTVTLTGQVECYYRDKLMTDITAGWVSPVHLNTTTTSFFLTYNGTDIAWRDLSTYSLEYSELLITVAVYDTNNAQWFYLREPHGFMPWENHRADHLTVGTYKVAGGDSSAVVIGSTVEAERRPDISQTTIRDEDVATTNPLLSSKLYTLGYNTGVGVFNFVLDSADITPLLTNNPYYNSFDGSNWGQTLLPANSVATVWVMAIPVCVGATCQKYRYVFVQPQWFTQSSNPSAGQLVAARLQEESRSIAELNVTSLTSLLPESVGILRYTIQYTSGNWTVENVITLGGSRVNQFQLPSGNFLQVVNHDTSLIGDGTTANPLSMSGSFTPETDSLTAYEFKKADGTPVLTIDTLTSPSKVIIHENFQVNGTETIINTETLQVEDKNIEIGVVDTPTDDTADQGGVTLKGSTDKTIIWDKLSDLWQFSHGINIPLGETFNINGVPFEGSEKYTGTAERTVGSITDGQVFTNASMTEMWDALIKQEKFPTLTPPSNTFTASITGLREVGDVITINFNAGFNRGSISPQYTATSPFRSGDPNTYEYIGTGLTNQSKTDLTDAQSLVDYAVIINGQSWQGRVSYDGGVQPKSSYDNNVDSPLPAGSTSYITRTITGVLPFFATTSDITTLTKQSLQTHGSVITVSFVEEDGTNKQTLEAPLLWGSISKIEQYNTLSGLWDTISTGSFTVSATTRNINGTDYDYNTTEHNGSTIGARQIRFTF